MAALADGVGAAATGVDVEAAGRRRQEAREVAAEDDAAPLFFLNARGAEASLCTSSMPAFLSMAKRANPRAMRSEVSAEGVVGRGMAYRWESGACAKVRPLKSWQMKPAGGSYPGRDTLYGI